MVLVRVDGIGSNHVGAQLLQVGNVALTVGVVGQGVGVVRVVRGRAVGGVLLLVGNTTDEEFSAVVGIKQFVAL